LTGLVLTLLKEMNVIEDSSKRGSTLSLTVTYQPNHLYLFTAQIQNLNTCKVESRKRRGHKFKKLELRPIWAH